MGSIADQTQLKTEIKELGIYRRRNYTEFNMEYKKQWKVQENR